MKKIIILMLLLAFATTSFSQQIDQKQSLQQTDYLKKSKKQKKAGRILLAVGTGLIAASFIIPRGDLVYDGICIGAYCTDKYKNDKIKSAVLVAGGITALGSIPFYIASSKNRKRAKALSVSFKRDNAFIVNNYNSVNISYPAISLNIGLN